MEEIAPVEEIAPMEEVAEESAGLDVASDEAEADATDVSMNPADIPRPWLPALSDSRAVQTSLDAPSVELPDDSSPLSGFMHIGTDDMPSSGVFMMAGGVFQLMVFVPVPARPEITESEVATLGTTWTHGVAEEVPSFPAAMRTVEAEGCSGESLEADHGTCGICMQSFDEGDKLTALPCATHGCGSVWHLQCIHQWLNQGRTASCPLCRAQLDVGEGSSPQAPSLSTMTILGNSNDRSGSRHTQDLAGLLLQALVSRHLNSTSRDGMPSLGMPGFGMPSFIVQASSMEQTEDLGVPREPTSASPFLAALA